MYYQILQTKLQDSGKTTVNFESKFHKDCLKLRLLHSVLLRGTNASSKLEHFQNLKGPRRYIWYSEIEHFFKRKSFTL